MYILYWNMWRRYCFGPLCPDSTVFSATETNHGLSMWYFKPYIRGDPKYRKPTKWLFDGLTSSPFPKEMMQSSVDILKKAAPVVRKEYLENVVQKLTMHPDQRTEIEKGGSWDWNFLYGTTGKNDEVCDRVPLTTAVVHSLPTVYNYGFVFFSRLKPGTHIKPHTGSTNLRIRLHLGLVIPSEPDYTATIRVGTEQQAWVQDDVLVFDDAFEHEVVYEGETERAVFIIDLWHPTGMLPIALDTVVPHTWTRGALRRREEHAVLTNDLAFRDPCLLTYLYLRLEGLFQLFEMLFDSLFLLLELAIVLLEVQVAGRIVGRIRRL
jgi:hypothetical protein